MKSPLLSIVCPALACRRGQWSILDDLRAQCRYMRAELIVLEDDGGLSIGAKMNALNRVARGEYVAGVADDDHVAEDYVESIVSHLGRSDVVTFMVDWDGAFGWKPGTCGYRPLAAVRTELAREFIYPEWWQTEDNAFRVWLMSRKPSTYHINRILYRYEHRQKKPEFGNRPYSPRSHGSRTGAEVAAVMGTQR